MSLPKKYSVSFPKLVDDLKITSNIDLGTKGLLAVIGCVLFDHAHQKTSLEIFNVLAEANLNTAGALLVFGPYLMHKQKKEKKEDESKKLPILILSAPKDP